MSVAVRLYTRGSFDASRRGPVDKLREAVLNANLFEARRLVNPALLNHEPADFNVRCTTDSNDAAGATNFALNLSEAGLTVASGALRADEQRDLFVSVMAANGSNRYRFRTRQRIGVSNGELVLVGPNEFLTDCRARVAATVATNAAAEIAAQCRAPAWWDGGNPVMGDFSSGVAAISWLGDGVTAPVGSITPIGANLYPTSAALANYRLATLGGHSVADGTSDLSSVNYETDTGSQAVQPVDGIVTAEALITPPISAQWFVNSSATPDELLLCPVGIASDVVTWDISVLIGDPIFMPLA